MRRAKIRTLRPSESIPEGEPKRYRNSSGYVRLRWLVGTQEYVEEYEHRIVAGRPAPWLHVHHINGVKDDNRLENLEVLTPAEHEARHGNLEKRGAKGTQRYAPYKSKHAMEKAQRRLAREAARRAEVERMRSLYLSGMTTYEVAAVVGIDESNVYRRLVAAGVRMRGRVAKELDCQEIAGKYAAGRSSHSLAREYRVTSTRILEAVDEAGVPRRKPGHPSHPRRISGENKARELVYARSRRVCEKCGSARASEWHHRKNRSQGGKWDVSNGLDLCTKCHLEVTDTNGSREQYEQNGWIVASWRDPARAEVLMWHEDRQDWFFLLEDGSVELAPFPSGDPRHPDDIPWPPVESSEVDGAA